jgi:hypothetical protein
MVASFCCCLALFKLLDNFLDDSFCNSVLDYAFIANRRDKKLLFYVNKVLSLRNSPKPRLLMRDEPASPQKAQHAI